MLVRNLPGEIPAPHREVFEAIDEEVTWVHAVWKTYCQLYAEKETVDLLNKVAPAWAKIQQDALLDDVLLSLSRLTDRPVTMGRQNLVLDRLKELATASGQDQLRFEVGAALVSTKDACAELREHRNKRLAHLDLGTALAEASLPLPSREKVDVALTMVREVINALNSYYLGGPTIYDEVGMKGDGRSLVACLLDGLRFRALRRSHGKMTEEEIRFALSARGLKGEDLFGSGE